MKPPVIAAIGHVALGVRDLDAAIRTATEVMGLRVSGSGGGFTYATNGRPHHSIQYAAADRDGIDHLGLEAADHGALVEIRERLERDGIAPLEDWRLDDGIDAGFAFVGPEGFVIEVYVGMTFDQPTYAPVGVRPSRFGHVNFTVRDARAMIDFLHRVLDFRVSDYVGDGAFMRCNVDHHGIGVMPGDGQLHHHAWEVESIADLARLGDVLAQRDEHLLWGPVRHGVGNNIAAYFAEPAGTVVEYYTDMDRIYDEAGHKPGSWTLDGQRWYSVWSPGFPDGFVDFGLPPAERAPASSG